MQERPHRRFGPPGTGGQQRGRGHHTIVRAGNRQDNQVSALRDGAEMSGLLLAGSPNSG
jgi:hypothetical protein